MENSHRFWAAAPFPAVADPDGIDLMPYSRQAHHQAIPEVYGRAFAEDPWPADWEQFDQFDARGVFVAQRALEVVGFVVSFRQEDYGYISALGVLPEWRRRGVGAALVARAMTYLASLECDRVAVDVFDSDPGAQAFYRRLGLDASAGASDGGCTLPHER